VESKGNFCIHPMPFNAVRRVEISGAEAENHRKGIERGWEANYFLKAVRSAGSWSRALFCRTSLMPR